MLIKFRMPVKTQIKGKYQVKWGKWDSLHVDTRAELHQLRDGILKGAQVRVPDTKQPATRLQNRAMQHLCGMA